MKHDFAVQNEMLLWTPFSKIFFKPFIFWSFQQRLLADGLLFLWKICPHQPNYFLMNLHVLNAYALHVSILYIPVAKEERIVCAKLSVYTGTIKCYYCRTKFVCFFPTFLFQPSVIDKLAIQCIIWHSLCWYYFFPLVRSQQNRTAEKWECYKIYLCLDVATGFLSSEITGFTYVKMSVSWRKTDVICRTVLLLKY